MNAQRASNTITKLELVDGTLIEGEDPIVEEIISLFKNIYTASRGCWKGIEGWNGVQYQWKKR